MINIVQEEVVECASNDAGVFYRHKVHWSALQISFSLLLESPSESCIYF